MCIRDRAFCNAWFETRDVGKTTGFLCADIDFIGTGEQETARGLDAMRAYIITDIQELDEPFSVAFPVMKCRLLQADLGSVFTCLLYTSFLEMKKIRRATGNSFSIAVIIEYGRGKLDRDKTRAFRTGDETVSWL